MGLFPFDPFAKNWSKAIEIPIGLAQQIDTKAHYKSFPKSYALNLCSSNSEKLHKSIENKD